MAQAQAIEYSIYTFNKADGSRGAAKWQKLETVNNMENALKKAQNLVDSREFQKVEVKKKYFEERTGRQIDMTLRVFEFREKKDFSLLLLCILAVLLGMAAFAATYYFVQ